MIENERLLPPVLADLVRRMSGAEAEHFTQSDLSSVLLGLGSSVVSATESLYFEYAVVVGMTPRPEALAARLRQLEPLGLCCAPVVVGLYTLHDVTQVLLLRYPCSAGDRLVPVDECPGPVLHVHRARFLEDLRRLHDSGQWHARAHEGSAYWFRGTVSGTLVLADWSALCSLESMDDPEEVLGDVEETLNEIPVFRGSEAGAAHLARVYTDYLRDPRPTRLPELARALVDAGRGLEAELLDAHLAGLEQTTVQEGPFRGRTAYLAQRCPTGEAGQVWLDPEEMGAAVHTGTTWLSTEPVSGWQLRAWRDAGRLSFADTQAMLGSPDDRSPVVNLSPEEAESLCAILGKHLPSRSDWTSARKHLTDDEFDALWRDPIQVWTADRLAGAPEKRVRASRITSAIDPAGELRLAASLRQMLADPGTRSDGVGVHTARTPPRG